MTVVATELWQLSAVVSTAPQETRGTGHDGFEQCLVVALAGQHDRLQLRHSSRP